MNSNPALIAAIINNIATTPQQRITFAEYMEMVLYHPEHSYYATNAVNIGFQGDFFTSPHLAADFGEMLGKQFVEMWEILGRPVPFCLVEMGAGQGILAVDILKYLQQDHPDLLAVLDYLIVEKSPVLRQEQQQRLQAFPVRWCSLEEIPVNDLTGCVFSNELVDALPVHQFTLHQGKLREIYVTVEENLRDTTLVNPGTAIERWEFKEIIDEPSTLEIFKYFDLIGIEISSPTYPDGYRSEVNLAALDWLQKVANCLKRGYLLTIDYGYPASRYYNPARSQGTLQCYWRHSHHDNPYINIGLQDITAHVDFTALEVWGQRCGLDNLGFVQQGLFLMALGLGERIAALSYSNQPLQEILSRRQALHQLLDPMGLGGFGVLLQSKGLTAAEVSHPLKGLTALSL
ncbi:MAG: class I SAM-dependent methyltransferase [Nostocaceae cyanobacterium]|nr:class I SAM-dependent methyltransferase [Nostocaceae cyanobacterium]